LEAMAGAARAAACDYDRAKETRKFMEFIEQAVRM
jgi:hypothetical protein